jgi:hypothetical protein
VTPGLRKLALTAHVTSSVGWLGAVAGFLALAVAGLTSEDAQMVRAAYLAMELTGWFVIVPLRIQLVADAGAALLVLLVATTLSVYKPQGRTRYGRRKQHEQDDTGDDTGVGPSRGSTTSTPRCVYVFGIILIVLILLVVIQHLTGGGLGGHTPR